jgi:hypothetical protein
MDLQCLFTRIILGMCLVALDNQNYFLNHFNCHRHTHSTANAQRNDTCKVDNSDKKKSICID